MSAIPTMSEVSFQVVVKPEIMSIQDAFDDIGMQSVAQEGSVWGWAQVSCVAHFEGKSAQSSFLGGISCESEETFILDNSDYYELLKAEAYNRLCNQ